jgi:hypothetical protein
MVFLPRTANKEAKNTINVPVNSSLNDSHLEINYKTVK